MLLLTTLMFAQAAVATPASTPTVGTTTGMAPTAKVECRMVAEAGTRIPSRVCRLDKEWELLAKDAQEDLRTSRNRTVAPNNSE